MERRLTDLKYGETRVVIDSITHYPVLVTVRDGFAPARNGVTLL